MCMLSAVIGHPKAAEKLRDMTEAQEAFFGGYYTGICTLHQSAFSLKKEVGSLSNLEKQSSLTQMTGSAGIAHSRTKSGGGAERAQPFIDSSKILAGMGTGIHGIFGSEKQQARQDLANLLVKAGVVFTSSQQGLGGSARLSDGSTIHNTELVVQAVAWHVNQGKSPQQAISEVVTQIPAEGAYIFLFRDLPEELFIANFNMRLLVAPCDTHLVVASSTLGLSPEEKPFAQEAPMNALLTCRADTIQEAIVDKSNAHRLSHELPSNLDELFLDYVKANPGQPWSSIIEHAFCPVFPKDKATLLLPLGFQVAERLLISGRVTKRQILVEGGTTPETKVKQDIFEAV